MTEQRREFRITTDRAIEVYLSNGQRIKACMVNLSTSGLAIRYPAPGEIGAELRLLFQLPHGDNLIMIDTRAIVRHSHIYHGDFITGLEFIALDADTSKTIAHFLDSRRTAQHASGVVVNYRSHH